METSSVPILRRWDTPLSDLKELIFSRLFEDPDGLRYRVADGTGQEYEIVLDQPGPYRMSDEAHLLHYWSAIPSGCGSTFKVDNPSWTEDLQLLDVLLPEAELYVVATIDACFEMLTPVEPRIIVL